MGNSGKLRIAVIFSSIYILMAFAWWSMLLLKKNADAKQAHIELLRYELAEKGMYIDDIQFKLTPQYAELEDKYGRQKTMVWGEGGVLFVGLLIVVWLINRSFFIEVALSKQRQNFRWQVNYKINPEFTFRNRAELIWYDRKGSGAQNGFLSYVDFIYKPMLKKYSGNMRLMYFETGGYDSRLYAYENDVLYSFSIPVFYDKGYRYYLNFNYDINKKLSLWIKWAQTIYTNQTLIGSGLDEITGNKKSEIKLQAMYKF